MQFPNISNPSYPLKENYEDTSMTSQFEDGSMQSRSKFTRSRHTFQLQWNSLPKSEYTVLMNFIVNQAKFAANIFAWTNPADDVTYNVRCTKVNDVSLDTVNCWKVSLEFTEV